MLRLQFACVQCFTCRARLWSRYSNFRLLVQHLEAFGSGCRTMWLKKSLKKHFIICIGRLPHKLSLWNRNQNFKLRLHHLKVFGSGSSHPKLLRFHLHSPGAEAGCDLLADCSSVGLYCVTITWQHLQTFTWYFKLRSRRFFRMWPEFQLCFFSHRSAFFSQPECLSLILKNHVKSGLLKWSIHQQPQCDI